MNGSYPSPQREGRGAMVRSRGAWGRSVPGPHPPRCKRSPVPVGGGTVQILWLAPRTSHVLPDEGEGGVGDFAPAVVDGQRMAAALDLDDLGLALVLPLLLVGGVGDRPRHGVVLLARDDEQRPALGILRVDLGLGPRIEVGERRLEEWFAGRGYGKLVVKLV